MKTRSILSLTAVAALGVAALTLTAQPIPAPAAAAQTANPQVARGEYLVKIMACHDCHTPWKVGAQGPEPDMTRMLSGHPQDMVVTPPKLQGPWVWAGAGTNTAFAGPWGVSFTANLTPDPETGLGKWTEDTFIEALRSGRHEGRGVRSFRRCRIPVPAGDQRGPACGLRLPPVAPTDSEPRAAADGSSGDSMMRLTTWREDRGRIACAPSGSSDSRDRLRPGAASAMVALTGEPARRSAGPAPARGCRRRGSTTPGARSTRAIAPSSRSTRCGRTARRRRAGSACRRERRSTSRTSMPGVSRWEPGSGRSSRGAAARSRRA